MRDSAPYIARRKRNGAARQEDEEASASLLSLEFVVLGPRAAPTDSIALRDKVGPTQGRLLKGDRASSQVKKVGGSERETRREGVVMVAENGDAAMRRAQERLLQSKRREREREPL